MSRSIKENKYHPLPSTVSPFVQQLMDQLLNKDPEGRPDAGTILRMKEIVPIKN
jgi:hypothetical protein